jgi:hypothetical protein
MITATIRDLRNLDSELYLFLNVCRCSESARVARYIVAILLSRPMRIPSRNSSGTI